ncbi:MAG TPA: PilZ domain-containing protein [Candidatus Methylomirabilis sp.]|nr:PilZ domain-containing protein [Candidatus Methylomirabilis sp.]
MSMNDHSPKGPRAKVQTPAARAPRPPDTYVIQRRGARVPMQDPAPIQLHLRAADLLDISLSGALVEHIVGVRVGEVYRLFFPVRGVEVEVLARAVRSFVSRVSPVAGGEGQIVYRTGLEFVELKESMAKTLTAYIDELHQQAATRRSAQPTALVPEGRTKVPNRKNPTTGAAALPSGRGKGVPANQLPRTIPERRAWTRWSPAGVLMLGSVLVSSLLYVGGTDIHKRWGPPRVLVTAAPVPAAAMPSTGGEPTSGLPSAAGGWAESEMARLGSSRRSRDR